MDTPILTGIISATVAVGGTIAAFVGRSKDADTNSMDKRLALLFTANKDLVDNLQAERADLRTERTDLIARLAAVEERYHQLNEEMTKMRGELTQQSSELTEQAVELDVLRQREVELRTWTTAILAWADLAMEMIQDIGGNIDRPPPLPPLPVKVG